MSEWKLIQTAPTDGTVVLVCWQGHDVVTFGSCREGRRARDGMPTTGYSWPVLWGNYPTHWMPKPAAKKSPIQEAICATTPQRMSKMDTITGIHLMRVGDYVIVKAEIDGRWCEVIRERHDGSFSHIVEPSGIREAAR